MLRVTQWSFQRRPKGPSQLTTTNCQSLGDCLTLNSWYWSSVTLTLPFILFAIYRLQSENVARGTTFTCLVLKCIYWSKWNSLLERWPPSHVSVVNAAPFEHTLGPQGSVVLFINAQTYLNSTLLVNYNRNEKHTLSHSFFEMKVLYTYMSHIVFFKYNKMYSSLERRPG